MNLLDLLPEEDHRRATEALALDRSKQFDLRKELSDRGRLRNYQAMLDSVKDWRPPELPDLSQFSEVLFNVETTGLRWYDQDRIVSGVLQTPVGRYYLPIRHKIGPNIPEGQFFEWLRREMRGKRIVNIRTKFDLHMLREDGVDLEAQGCTFGDVAHYAGLLNDHRRRFNLDLLSNDLLGWDVTKDPLGKLPPGIQHEGQFHELPAGIVAPYGLRNIEQVDRLLQLMWPQLDAQGLHEVRELEDQIIPVVVEMEHNGCPLDVETLNDWCRRSENDIKQIIIDIKKATGIEFEKLSNRDDKMRLFTYLKVPLPLDPETGKVSFADALLKDIQEPTIQRFRAGAQLESLRSKFLLKYQRSVARDGILRYELHQMPYQEDDEGGGGAISGRFSSAAPSRQEGANIQQVFGVETQKKFKPYTADYIVKKLFKPEHGQWVNADASQLQFRIFAHYADSPKIIEAYARDHNWREIDARAAAKRAVGEPLTKDDKLTDFHDTVSDLVLEFAHKVLTRTHTKNVNFAQVFGAGPRKMAAQIGVPADQIPSFEEPLSSGGPLFQEVLALSETYHEMFPEVKPLLRLTSHLAMPGHNDRGDKHRCGRACRRFYEEGYEHRGWVRTFKGRRRRFSVGDRFYSALNAIIQGTEADVIKRVLVEAHNRRHELGLTERFTVHDALDGDLQGCPRKFKEMLNTQYYDFRVPILWEVGLGPTWADAK